MRLVLGTLRLLLMNVLLRSYIRFIFDGLFDVGWQTCMGMGLRGLGMLWLLVSVLAGLVGLNGLVSVWNGPPLGELLLVRVVLGRVGLSRAGLKLGMVNFLSVVMCLVHIGVYVLASAAAVLTSVTSLGCGWSSWCL